MVKENGMVMMTETELKRMEVEKEDIITDYERRIELLQEAITELIHRSENGNKAVRVSKLDFIAMYKTALEYMWDHEENNDIYGKDFEVHWNGIYCNCGDGAAPSNYLIPGVEGIADEDPTEY